MPEVAVYAPGTPMWVDLGTSDIEASKRFYSGLFGWESEDMGEEAGHYHMFKLRGKNVAGVGPLMMDGQPVAWTTYISTDSADDTCAKVKTAGGKVFAEPMDVMDAGRMAIIGDPTGAVFGLWQSNRHTGAEIVNEAGALCWNELSTRDTDGAKKFYTEVFGWGEETHKGEMDYTEWKVRDKSVGGMMNMTGIVPDQVPPHWLTYFAVADCDAAAAKAKELGGKLMTEPRDIPQGRFAVVTDPQGGTFAIIQLKAAE